MPPIPLRRLSLLPRRTPIRDYLRQLRRFLRRRRFRSLRFALRRAMRFFSPLDMKKRFLRISLNTRSFCTFLRKRFSSCSGDSPDLNATDTNVLHLLALEYVLRSQRWPAAGALCQASSCHPMKRPDGDLLVSGARQHLSHRRPNKRPGTAASDTSIAARTRSPARMEPGSTVVFKRRKPVRSERPQNTQAAPLPFCSSSGPAAVTARLTCTPLRPCPPQPQADSNRPSRIAIGRFDSPSTDL